MIHQRRASPLHAARAGIGAAWCLTLMAVALSFEHPLLLAALLGVTLAAAAAAHVGRFVVRSLRWAIPFALAIAVINALITRDGLTVLFRGGTVPGLGRIDITAEAVAYGAVLGLRAVVLRGAGERAFIGGADLRDLARLDPDSARDFIGALHEVCHGLRTLPVPVIAAIRGHCLGAGLEVAASCDLRVAASEAQLGLPEARLGLLPGAGGTQRLTRLCGTGVARRLILAGEAVSGSEAREFGLVQWVVPGGELDEFAARLAAQVGAMAPDALASCKRCLSIADGSMQHGMATEIHETIALLDNPDTRARVSDFLRKRGG